MLHGTKDSCPVCTQITGCASTETCSSSSKSQCATCSAMRYRVDGTKDSCPSCASGKYSAAGATSCPTCAQISDCTTTETCTRWGQHLKFSNNSNVDAHSTHALLTCFQVIANAGDAPLVAIWCIAHKTVVLSAPKSLDVLLRKHAAPPATVRFAFACSVLFVFREFVCFSYTLTILSHVRPCAC